MRRLVFTCALLLPPLAQAAPLPAVPHQVLAFYYGWYSSAFTSWIPSARWTPAAGAYNSIDAATIARQVADAKAAGITGFIVSWWGQGSGSEKQMNALLPVAAANGIAISVLFEQFGDGTTTPAPADAAAALSYVLTTYGGNDAFLKVAGRPAIFLYDRALQQVPTAAGWQSVLDSLRATTPGAIVLTTGAADPDDNPQLAANFDGYFLYSLNVIAKDQSLPDIEARLRKSDLALANASGSGQIACVTVGPGYDDSHAGRPPPRPLLQRFDGATYRASWRAAVAADPDWVLVSTYNEWIEGTQIEPSVEFGRMGITDTTTYSRAFLALPLRHTGS